MAKKPWLFRRIWNRFFPSANPVSTPAMMTPMPAQQQQMQTPMPAQQQTPMQTPISQPNPQTATGVTPPMQTVAPNMSTNPQTPIANMSTNAGPQQGQVSYGWWATPPMQTMQTVAPTPTQTVQPPQPTEPIPEVTEVVTKDSTGTKTQTTKKTVPPAPVEPQPVQPDMAVYDTDTMMSNLAGGNNQFIVGDQASFKTAQGRMNAMDMMVQQDPATIANMIEIGRFAKSDYFIKDIAKFRPEFYQQVVAEVKNQKALNYLNSLSDNIMKNSKSQTLSPGQIAYEWQEDQQPTPIEYFNDTTFTKLQEKFGSNAEKFVAATQELMQSPEIQAQAEKVKQATDEANKIKAQIDQVETDARQLMWSEVPESIVGSYIARMTRDLTNSYQAAYDVANAERDFLTDLRDQAMQTLDAYQKGTQLDIQQQQFAQQQANTDRAFDAQQAQQMFNNQLDLAKINSTATAERKKDTDSWLYYRTWADGQLEFNQAPDMGGAQPSGEFTTINIPTAHKGWINAQVDTVAAPSLSSAFQEMSTLWLKPQVNMKEWVFRSKEQQQALYDKYQKWGHLAAAPGTSLHEKGLAVDITNVNDQMVAVMNKNGWFQNEAIKKNDPGHFEFKGVQTQWWFDPSKFPQYINYMETGKLPVWMKDWSPAAKQFIAQAQEGYISGKEKSFNPKWFTIANPDAFIGTDDKQKVAISDAVAQVQPFIQSMDKVIELAKKYNTELPFTVAGKEINQEVKNAQLIAKEIYNLWVLNGPDLSLMEAIISNPAWNFSKFTFRQNYSKQLERAKKTILDNAISKLKSAWLEYIGANWTNFTSEY